MNSDPILIDIYPSLTTKVPALPSQLHAHRIADPRNLLPFEISLAHDTVHYTSLPRESRNYSQHIRYLVQSIYLDCSVRPFCWQKMDEHLKRGKRTRKYVNNKTCFQYKDHTFLTKACFTSGLRCVDARTVHLLQIGHHPLYLYYVEAARAETTVFTKNHRCFAMEEESQFARIELQSYTKYTLPAGTYYVLNSACKTYFSLHIVPQETVVDFPVLFLEDLKPYKPYEKFQTPRASLRTRLSRAWEDEPPATPRIEEVLSSHRNASTRLSRSLDGEIPATPRREEVPFSHRNASASASTDERWTHPQNQKLPENPVRASGDFSFQGTGPAQTTVSPGLFLNITYTSLFSHPVQGIPCATEDTFLPSADRTGILEDPPTNLSIFLDPLSQEIPETSQTEPASQEIPEMGGTEPAIQEFPETSRTNPASQEIPEMGGTEPAIQEFPETSRTNPANQEIPDRDKTSFELPVEDVYGPAAFSLPKPMTPLPHTMDSLDGAPLSFHTRKRFISWFHHFQGKTYGRPVETEFQKSTESGSALDLRVKPYSPILSP